MDSRKDLAVAVNEMLAELGAAPLGESVVTSMVGEGARVLVERALAAAQVPGVSIESALHRFLRLYDGHLLDHTQPYPGIREVVGELSGRASLAVLTNKPGSHSERILEGLGLRSYFAQVIGGDSTFPRKPDPAALVHLVQTHGSGLRNETMMVGDSRIDVETARNAGVACCLVRYGFGFPAGMAEETDLFIADTPERIPEIVQRSIRTSQLLPPSRR